MDNQEYKTVGGAPQKEKEIDLSALFKSLFKKLWLIAAVALIAGAASFAYARFFVKPTYQAFFTAYINNKQSSHSSDSLTNSDILASQELVRTYSKILTSNTVLMRAADLLDEDYTYTSLAKI